MTLFRVAVEMPIRKAIMVMCFSFYVFLLLVDHYIPLFIAVRKWLNGIDRMEDRGLENVW